MIETKVKSEWFGEKVKKHLEDTTFKSINHAAASLRMIARRSIRRRKKPSAPGTPPNTQTGRLRDGIIFYATRTPNIYAIIGPSYQFVGTSAVAHEFGGQYKHEKFPLRKFMQPAMEKIIPRLPAEWQANY
jgi:hypothetical protein